jgi:hypothetical protein
VIPLLAGAAQLIVAEALPLVAAPIVGAPGSVAEGVTELDALENEPVPTALIAATVKV